MTRFSTQPVRAGHAPVTVLQPDYGRTHGLSAKGAGRARARCRHRLFTLALILPVALLCLSVMLSARTVHAMPAATVQSAATSDSVGIAAAAALFGCAALGLGASHHFLSSKARRKKN